MRYQPKEPGADPYDLDGVWSAPSEVVDIGAPSMVSAIGPKLGVHVADLPEHDDPKERIGDTFTRAGVVWKVIDVQEDGEGGADLILHRG